MSRRRSEQDSDWTRRYRQDAHDADDTHSVERFSKRSKFAQQMKTRRTVALRESNLELAADIQKLPVGEVIQVFSVFVEVLFEGRTYRCTSRRTQQRAYDTQVVVGDLVRLRVADTTGEGACPEGSIEQILPRTTVLMRQDSFRKDLSDPIVANAGQMLIVTAILEPRVKWGLVDRMLIAAQSGGLEPLICVNKMDLVEQAPEACAEVQEVLAHYQAMGIKTLRTSCQRADSIDAVRGLLAGRRTVLAGHSGVGKSSLIRSLVPGLEIRVAAVSQYNDKGRHTTTSARRYVLPFGGEVVDTPGIRQFGLVGVDGDSLIQFFPDVADESAPPWRVESYQRILESL